MLVSKFLPLPYLTRATPEIVFFPFIFCKENTVVEILGRTLASLFDNKICYKPKNMALCICTSAYVPVNFYVFNTAYIVFR